ncbi:MAG: ABC transporter permease [Chloroflexi bacterium]|nr:ABC transporter permease [Chloroflexota bacterium]
MRALRPNIYPVRNFIVRRLLQSILLLLVVVTAIFFLIHLTPGGPEAALANNPRTSAEDLQRLRERFGLTDPLPMQYLRWLASAAHLDFGRSYFYARPAIDVVAERLGPTIQLGLMSYLVALLGIPLGVLAALHRGRMADGVIRLFTTLGHALPTWWFGLTLIVVLNSLIGWFPNGQGSGSLWQWFIYMIFPAMVLGLAVLVTFTRFVRSEVLEVLNQDYVRTAQAKGLPTPWVTTRHVLRNALLPVVTLLGYILPFVFSGALITEYVFAWPGVGRLFYEAAVARDYPILLAILTMTTVATIIGTLIADVAYGVVDPRVRYT